MSLVTLSDVKTQLNMSPDVTTNDVALNGYIAAVDTIIEGHTGYLVTSQTLTTDLIIDAWTKRLVIPAKPLTAVTSLTSTDGTVTYDLTDALVLAPGVLVLPYRVYGPLSVVYTAGYADPPANFKQAALLIVQHLWKSRRGPVGRGSSSDMPDSMAPREVGYAIPNAALELLGRRSPAVA